jgi:hypothetical protein
MSTTATMHAGRTSADATRDAVPSQAGVSLATAIAPGSSPITAIAARSTASESSREAGISASSGKTMTSNHGRCCGEATSQASDSASATLTTGTIPGPRGSPSSSATASSAEAASASSCSGPARCAHGPSTATGPAALCTRSAIAAEPATR